MEWEWVGEMSGVDGKCCVGVEVAGMGKRVHSVCEILGGGWEEGRQMEHHFDGQAGGWDIREGG